MNICYSFEDVSKMIKFIDYFLGKKSITSFHFNVRSWYIIPGYVEGNSTQVLNFNEAKKVNIVTVLQNFIKCVDST